MQSVSVRGWGGRVEVWVGGGERGVRSGGEGGSGKD